MRWQGKKRGAPPPDRPVLSTSPGCLYSTRALRPMSGQPMTPDGITFRQYRRSGEISRVLLVVWLTDDSTIAVWPNFGRTTYTAADLDRIVGRQFYSLGSAMRAAIRARARRLAAGGSNV